MIYLGQAERLLSRMDAAQYAMPHAHCFGASIGGHVRHCLDHFDQFLLGITSGRVDYDHRERGGAVETDPDVATFQIQSIAARLEAFGRQSLSENADLEVKLDCGGDCAHWKRSSAGRELQFLVSHMVHHFAIIGIMCKAMDVDLEPDFGLAPSTVKHQATA